MHALAPSTPRVIPGRTIDTLDLASSGGVSRGFIRVDLQDPVFFDHPLDHVPGMLLVVAGLELAEHAAMLRPANVSFRLTFTKFCELDAPVEVSATRETGGNTFRIHPIRPQHSEGTAGPTRDRAACGACPGASIWERLDPE